MTAQVEETNKRPVEEAVVETETDAKKAKIDSKLAETEAYGKLILFGEHFVVYKAPALVGAVAASTNCAMEFTGEDGDIEIVDNRPAIPNYKTKKAEEGRKAVELVLKHLKVEKGVKLTFGGDLCCVSATSR